MRIDRYTKVLLTLIAASLMAIAFDGLFEVKPAEAVTQTYCSGTLTTRIAGADSPGLGGFNVSVTCM